MTTNGIVNGHPSKGVDHDAASNVSLLQSFLAAHPDVRIIRYYAPDYCGTLRTRFTTTARALQLATRPNAGPSSGSPLNTCGLQSGGVLMELIVPGEDIWVPDWTSLREFGASKGTATVFCYIEQHLTNAGEGTRVTCSRTILKNVLRDAKADHNVDFMIGFEVEWYLVESVNATKTVDSPPGVWQSSSIHVPDWRNVVEETVLLLEAAGVHVWGFCTEAGSSKYEIALSPLPPVEAIDALHFTQETIKQVAQLHGHHATMHAKAFEEGPTAGRHVHLSLSRPELGTPFLAGLLKHFRALCALMLSNVESYQRSGQFGYGPVVWGWMNKLTCVRRMQDAYFEIRPPDAFSCMYLTLAAIIGVGLKGIENEEELTSKSLDFLCLTDPPTEEQRKQLNITEDLPANLGESIAAFKADMVIKEVLGENAFDAYVYNKEKDLEASKKLSSAERRKALLQQF